MAKFEIKDGVAIIPKGAREIPNNAFFGCSSLTTIIIPESVTRIESHAFYGCSSLEIVHLPVDVSNIGITSFKGCNNLKAIYVPKDKVDFYKERFPVDMHWLIVEEGSALPVKVDNFIAKDISFAPLRVIVPKGASEDYILSVVKKKLKKCGGDAVIEWIIANLDTITDSKEAYNVDKDEI